jgi:hypothetical protein
MGCADCAARASRGHEHPDSGRIDAIDERIDGIDERIDGTDERIDGNDRRFDATEYRPLTCSSGSCSAS